MKTQPPALLPIFRSQLQAQLLAWLSLHPDDEYSLSDLARRLDAKLPTLHREVERLSQAGLVTDRELGRNRMLRLDPAHPAIEPLTRLMELTFGPRWVVANAFTDLAGVAQVILFGSWAARYLGQPGPPPHDIDVLVVGDGISREAVYEAADEAQTKLGWPVNPVMRTTDQWRNLDDGLSAQIVSSPHLIVVNTEEPHGQMEPGRS
jgi:DNA-binding transcriptional ArsR family regulator